MLNPDILKTIGQTTIAAVAGMTKVAQRPAAADKTILAIPPDTAV